MCDGPQSTKNVFYESPESEIALLVYRRPRGIYAGLTSKLQREQTQREPRRSVFPALQAPTSSKLEQKMCLNSTFFRYSARPPHRATQPSRGWLRGGVSKPQLILAATVAARN